MRPFLLRLLAPLLATTFLALAGPATAFELDGMRTVTLHPHDGPGIVIGTVTFTPAGNGEARFEVHLDHGRFKDFFLSMKEFKCLEHPKEILCHVPYPYDNPRRVSAGDLGWLEHAFLFLHKSPREFGAKLWNGLIYDMKIGPDGIEGSLEAVDLAEISAPPDDLTRPPFDQDARGEESLENRWLPRITIR